MATHLVLHPAKIGPPKGYKCGYDWVDTTKNTLRAIYLNTQSRADDLGVVAFKHVNLL